MGKSKSNKIMNGTYGAVWVNNEKWMDVDEFEAKVSISYEEVDMAESPSTHRKMTGWEGEGSITVKKVYSRGKKLMAEAAKNGIQPDISLVGKLDDPDAHGAERVSIDEVTFNEFTLLAFEQKEPGTEELPFNFADYDLIDLVEAN